MEDKEIIEIRKRLYKQPFIPNNISRDLQPLRNACLYILSLVDALFDVLIGLSFTISVRDKLTDEERLQISEDIGQIVEPMFFAKKFQIVIDRKLASESLITQIKMANRLRVTLAHPLLRKSFIKIKDLEQKTEQLKEWKNLESISKAMQELKKK